MLNIDTLRILNEINCLASLSVNGIKPFSKVTIEEDNPNNRCIYYHDTRPFNKALCGKDFVEYPVVADYLIDEIHHDIISTYEECTQIGVERIAVTFSKEPNIDESPEISVYLEDRTDSEVISISNGMWYIMPKGDQYNKPLF